MTQEKRDYLEMAYHSIVCFANDGTLQVSELNEIMTIALRDGVVDENEKRVLRSIFAKLNPSELTPEMVARIAQIRQQANM